MARWLRGHWLEALLLVGLAALFAWYVAVGRQFVPEVTRIIGRPGSDFDGVEAFQHVEEQMDIGPRPVGSAGAEATAAYIRAELRQAGWNVEVQEFAHQGVLIRNLIAKQGEGPVVIIGAHYDTRLIADRDPDPARRREAVPGANDGASGVAVLLELARSLDVEKSGKEIWLAFFDGEDAGQINGWDFSVGAKHMADNLSVKPEAVIVVDMIGDADQQIFKERFSTPALTDRVWAVAERLGYDSFFLPSYKHAIMDDHRPFLDRGLDAIDIIDFDYPAWHTTADTIDKVAPESLERVGRVVETFLEGN